MNLAAAILHCALPLVLVWIAKPANGCIAGGGGGGGGDSSSNGGTNTGGQGLRDPSPCATLAVTNGAATAGPIASGAPTTITCDKGYEIATTTDTCTLGAYVTYPTGATCTESPCDTLVVTNGVDVAGPIAAGTTVNIVCDQFYEITPTTDTCSLGSFTNNPAVCTDLQCDGTNVCCETMSTYDVFASQGTVASTVTHDQALSNGFYPRTTVATATCPTTVTVADAPLRIPTDTGLTTLTVTCGLNRYQTGADVMAYYYCT